MELMAYLGRRLLLAIPTFFGITLVCFALIHVVPGGPVEERLRAMRAIEGGEAGAITTEGPSGVSEQYRQELVRHYGFDLPLLQRYVHWVFESRLGLRMPSYKFQHRTAWELIRSRIPISLWFGVTGFLLSYAVCIPLGIAKTLRCGSRFDLVSSVVVFVGYALPPFAVGMVLKMLLSGTVDGLWDWFPLGGFQSADFELLTPWGRFLDRARHMALPVSCYVLGNFAVLTLLMKNSLLDQIGSDYVRTVLAKGATRRRAIWRHALRNALIPVATGFGGVLMVMFAGSVVLERVFEIPGMGLLSLEALEGRDYPVFMGMLSLTSLLGLTGRILSDCCYVLIDPRIRFR